MRTCYIHCGPHKTGSTTLQRFLDAHPDLLAARGLWVPALQEGRSPTKSHIRLVAELAALARGDSARSPTWTRFGRMLAETDRTPVLTSEILSLHMMKPALLQAVTTFLARHGLRAHFLYLLRDQPAWLNSTYVQSVKRFYTALDFDPWLERMQERPRFDYAALLDGVLARDDADLTVLPFERSVAEGLPAAFLRAMGVAPPGPGEADAPGAENPNAGTRAVHAGRIIARHLARLGLTVRRHPDLYTLFCKRYRAHDWPRDPYCGLDDARAAAIRDRFRDRNDALAERLWGRPWEAVVPPRGGFVRRAWDPAAADPQDRAEVEAVIAEITGVADLVAALGQAGTGHATGS